MVLLGPDAVFATLCYPGRMPPRHVVLPGPCALLSAQVPASLSNAGPPSRTCSQARASSRCHQCCTRYVFILICAPVIALQGPTGKAILSFCTNTLPCPVLLPYPAVPQHGTQDEHLHRKSTVEEGNMRRYQQMAQQQQQQQTATTKKQKR